MVGPWAQRTLPRILVPLHSALWVGFVLHHAGLGWGRLSRRSFRLASCLLPQQPCGRRAPRF